LTSVLTRCNGSGTTIRMLAPPEDGLDGRPILSLPRHERTRRSMPTSP
jgi:hypothetical protein